VTSKPQVLRKTAFVKIICTIYKVSNCKQTIIIVTEFWISVFIIGVNAVYFQAANESFRRSSTITAESQFSCYWLLLRGGIVKSVPCTAAILWSTVLPHLSSNHFCFIHHSPQVAAEISSSEAGIWREMSLNLTEVVYLS
jgi:hypothetical protein